MLSESQVIDCKPPILESFRFGTKTETKADFTAQDFPRFRSPLDRLSRNSDVFKPAFGSLIQLLLNRPLFSLTVALGHLTSLSSVLNNLKYTGCSIHTCIFQFASCHILTDPVFVSFSLDDLKRFLGNEVSRDGVFR